MNKKRIHLMLTEAQHKKLVEISGRTGYSMSELLRRAVDAYLNATKKNNE